MTSSYGNDPRWITLKYHALQNGARIPAGTRVFYFPATKQMLTGEKAEQAARDFEAARFDEDFGG